MRDLLFVGMGGFFGAVLRYLAGFLPIRSQNGFPVITLLVNIVGAFLIGIVAALSAKTGLNPKLVLFLRIGLCGGFTTFSTFSHETVQLLQSGKTGIAAAYIAASVLCCIAAIFFAEWIIGKQYSF
ncbi:MAG TPA: fluoride efflux transporter CrcB [Oscillospiraceae bacterium]|nr:fluoride efflux transporter CrcB [Oscillospiraceae bacterium]HPF56169.1 fluoride efflux transporter CrcB [Clostridiales bacterium]HPK36052.1 fluoride efflux transporter CrcB [Oscillospiraceae bacterium]HPR75983.1 fluoride efflux transporter CrcB [Oscillospiraceae bacterium]